MPVSIWRELVDVHFPNSAWLRCSRETLDELSEFKAKRALPTWDSTLQALLAETRRAEAGAAGPGSAGELAAAADPEDPAEVSRHD
jgi:hypothetical protein